MAQYEGSCYIAVVGGENENGQCRDSIEAIETKEGDTRPILYRGTKGYEVRQMHLNNWYEKTEHPFILFLDHDMIFPQDTLARLRAHGLPYVSGLYMRRRYSPIAPIWFEYGEAGQMPMIPFTAPPLQNQLYKIGASGWGCVLIHRDVVTAMKAILKGELEIIEDDMDLYPYDLRKILAALKTLDTGINEEKGTLKRLRKAVKILRDELRPLRGIKDPIVGSDIRFPFYARLAGFDLYGDSGVECDHMMNYPLSARDFVMQPAATIRDITVQIRSQVIKEHEEIRKATE